MNVEELWERLETLEAAISRLEDCRWSAGDLAAEMDSLLQELRREAARVRAAIDREAELDRDALCREYEKSVL